MSLTTKIIKASSVVCVFCGAAYYYFVKKSNNSVPNSSANFDKSITDFNMRSQKCSSEIMEILSNLESLSKSICVEIDLCETIKKSLSTTLLKQSNNNNNNWNLSKNIENTLNNVSAGMKNHIFLEKFISRDGLSMIKKLFLCCDSVIFSKDSINIIVSEILSNISVRKESLDFLEFTDIGDLLRTWTFNKNIVLSLNAVKTLSNISQLNLISQIEKVIYTPDIFLLDHQSYINHTKDFDVVFINGMLGSVYFTWRQYDGDLELEKEEKTKCWPRDWLSVAVPKARIIGVNALLRPFVWNEMSAIDKMNRSIEKRAVEIGSKLEMAGIGSRPVLWVTHSAGGILLKHILHQYETKPLACATRGIMFISTPHCGAQSMIGLYYFPFKFFLTPEAKHLETNSEILLQLNKWFKTFADEKKIKIFTLIETEPTQINKFYSTIIVPKCDDEVSGSQIHIKSNHLYISKPKDQSDEIYLSVLNFVTETTKDL